MRAEYEGDLEMLEWGLKNAEHNPLYKLPDYSDGRDSYFPWGFGQSSSYQEVVKRMRQLLEVKSNYVGPKVDVLRNLDLKEYVRDDVIAAWEYAYSLGDVLGIKAKWNGESVGGWAGFRCDITEAGRWMSEEQWTDVSDDAIDRLASIVEPRETGRRVFDG